MIINTYTWTNDPLLQKRFDLAREQISRSSHPLAVNYRENFNSSEIIAYSMSCTDEEVFLCSSIARKEYWPIGVYRVINRVFKPEPKETFTKNIEAYWVDMILQQVDFCKSLPDFRTAIITRKLGYTSTLSHLGKYLTDRGLNNAVWDRPVWVCNDYHNPECQQNVLAIGEDVFQEFSC